MLSRVHKKEQGEIVVFLGPDGAGKTTVLNLIKERLAEKSADFRSYYFAPGFFPRYRPKVEVTVTTNPHDGRQYSTPVVAAKIALMLIEFRLGILMVRQQKGFLLFDRFVHDLLVDPRRYRMSKTRWWMRLMLKLAPKPDLIIVILAPAEIIQSRKQEVPIHETERQIQSYRALAKSFPNSLLIDNTCSPDIAAVKILDRLETL